MIFHLDTFRILGYSTNQMKTSTGENLPKFIYDCGRVAFTVFIAGTLTKKPWFMADLFWGVTFTLFLVLSAVMIEWFYREE